MEKSQGNTAKRLNASNLPPSLKRRFSRKVSLYLPSLLCASLFGTYLDLYFVGKQLYSFPIRPFSEIFSVNILFTLLILPFLTGLYLYLGTNMSSGGRFLFTILLSGFVPFVEHSSVQWGFFQPGDQWNHSYSLIGYFLFLMLMGKIFKWTKAITITNKDNGNEVTDI